MLESIFIDFWKEDFWATKCSINFFSCLGDELLFFALFSVNIEAIKSLFL